jgi:hypothetical protein
VLRKNVRLANGLSAMKHPREMPCCAIAVPAHSQPRPAVWGFLLHRPTLTGMETLLAALIGSLATQQEETHEGCCAPPARGKMQAGRQRGQGKTA